jgi:hypothetical protein
LFLGILRFLAFKLSFDVDILPFGSSTILATFFSPKIGLILFHHLVTLDVFNIYDSHRKLGQTITLQRGKSFTKRLSQSLAFKI